MDIVFLVRSSRGLHHAWEIARKVNGHVWCGSDVITIEEHKRIENPSVTRFTYQLKDQDTVDEALETIREHHPAATIWIEQEAA